MNSDRKYQKQSVFLFCKKTYNREKQQMAVSDSQETEPRELSGCHILTRRASKQDISSIQQQSRQEVGKSFHGRSQPFFLTGRILISGMLMFPIPKSCPKQNSRSRISKQTCTAQASKLWFFNFSSFNLNVVQDEKHCFRLFFEVQSSLVNSNEPLHSQQCITKQLY